VIITVGLPGSGKSTYLKQLGVPALSSDELRLMLTDDESEQAVNQRVFSLLRYMLRIRLALARPVTYVDATNLSSLERRPFVETAHLYDAEIEALYFDVPLDVCLERNRRRNRFVPEDVMQRFALKLAPPALEEGFSKITVVRS